MVARINIEDVLLNVAEHYGVKRKDIVSIRRHKSLAQTRHIAMYLAKKLTWLSLPEIGHAFDRHHTAVAKAIRKIEGQMQTDVVFKTEVEGLISRVHSRRVA